MGLKNIFDRHLVAIVMVPFIIGGQYAWWRMQQMEELVAKDERQPFPMVIVSFIVARLAISLAQRHWLLCNSCPSHSTGCLFSPYTH